MKKSLLALAVLGAFAGAASAQSSVTIYGKVDASVGKNIGNEGKDVLDGAPSRIGVRGVEDLGGGNSAIFSFEHRFDSGTGKADEADRFWKGHAWVGLKTGFGEVTLGRQYTAAYEGFQSMIDPFGGETVAKLRDIGMLLTSTTKVGETRIDNSLRYQISVQGVTFIATTHERVSTTLGDDRPMSFGLNYSAGPLWIGVGYEDPQGDDDKLAGIGARYKFGDVTLRGSYSKGTTAGDVDVKGYLIGADWQIGAGNLRVGYATSKLDNDFTSKKASIGYHYSLSKRTKLYADLTRDKEASTPVGDPSKHGYDFGIQHNF